MSRLLAWSFGASVGLAVGFLVGESFGDGLALARLGRPEPRSGVPAPRETPEGLNGPEIGVQRWGPALAEFGIDLADDEPCPHTLGPLTCPFKGPHTAHAYQSGTWAPDRKDDTDEGIE